MTVKTVTFDSKALAIKAYTDMFLVTPNKAQLGDTLNSILLKFETNGASESNINGIDVTGLDKLIYPEPVSENKIFTLTAKKDNQTKTKHVES